MNISFEKKEFSEKVSTASRFALQRHATLPALASLLIIASDDGVKLRSTNLETAADLKVRGTCREKGVAAVPAAILSQISSSLSGEGEVTLEQVGETLTVKTGTSKSVIKTVPYDDFPSIPFPESGTNRIVLPGATLKMLFSALAPCASASSVRPELASIYLSIEGGVLTAVATDSFRLAEKKIPLTGRGAQGKLLIPAKNAADIAHVLPNEDVIVSFDEHQCAFIGDFGTFITRLTNSVYPDYRQIIPKESIVEAIVLRRDFESALRRTAVFSDSFQKITLHFDPKKNLLSFEARNADIGESNESVPAKVSGDSIDLSFNHRYLATVLGLSNTESISFVATGVGRPLLIRGVGDPSLLYLVSPMNQ